MKSSRAARSVFSLPRLRGRVGGGGDWKRSIMSRAPSLSLQPKSDVSDFGRSIKRPNSGKPEFGCKRGRERCGTAHRATSMFYGRKRESVPGDEELPRAVGRDPEPVEGVDPKFHHVLVI